MIISIVSIIVIICEVLIITYFIIKSRKNNLLISKQNMLWFFPVFLFLFILYLTAYVAQTGTYSALALTKTIVSAIKTFTFEINLEYILLVSKSNIIFRIAFVISYLMACFTTISTALGFIKNNVKNLTHVRKIKAKGCDIVIGYNEGSFIYLEKHKSTTILWINNEISSDQIKYLYDNKIAFVKAKLKPINLKRFLKANTRYNFIAFDYVEEHYQDIIDTFINIQSDRHHVFLYLEVKFNEAEVVREEYLNNKTTESNLFIRMFSRYELIARKFISEVTISSLLPQDFYNQNRTIKKDHNINVFFYGFGKINASLFAMFCQNNQLVGQEGNLLVNHLVNYYVIDKDLNATNSQRIEYLLNSIDSMKSDFEKLEKICNFNIFPYDVNSLEGIEKVIEIASKPNSFNFFIVSFGSDFENAQTAKWIQNEFGQFKPVIACRLKKIKIENKDIIYFGNEAEIISHEYIIDDEILSFAREINAIYNSLDNKGYLEFEREWDKLNQIELYSNLYAGVNLKFKLNLLGFDLSKNDNQESVSFDEFMSVYSKDSSLNPTYEDYFKTTIRNVIGYSEKLRWNAYYLLNGYKPMLLKDIKIIEDDNGNKKILWKSHHKKQHACLTSMRGLDKLHKDVLNLFGKQLNMGLSDLETYKYDYMLFDNPDRNLIKTLLDKGYKITKLKII